MTEQAAENEVIGKQSTLLVESLFVFVFFWLFQVILFSFKQCCSTRLPT